MQRRHRMFGVQFGLVQFALVQSGTKPRAMNAWQHEKQRRHRAHALRPNSHAPVRASSSYLNQQQQQLLELNTQGVLRQQHISNTLATHWQHSSNTLATHQQHISNTWRRFLASSSGAATVVPTYIHTSTTCVYEREDRKHEPKPIIH